MSIATISEELFEKLCAAQGFNCSRIPENSNENAKTADYVVSLGSLALITEVKQLDPNDKDKKLAEVWGTENSPGMVAPSNRIQGLLEEGYPQVKISSEKTYPTMIVVYNNSGRWNYIDTFTVAKAMFGSYGIVLGLQSNQTIAVTGQGYLGKRKVTKNTFRSLSVVGVLKHGQSDTLIVDCYHNPFALIPINPSLLAGLANEQYMHTNPHERGFVSWEPTLLASRESVS